MRVDFWCSREPYIAHAAPVWHGLDESERGRFRVPDHLWGFAEHRGIAASAQDEEPADVLVVLSRSEFVSLPPRERLVFLEHGAGASYDRKSHILDSRHQSPEVHTVLTTPANAQAHRLSGMFPRVVEVGCPKLDVWHGYTHKRSRPPVVAVSHHWEQRAYPETRSSWPWDKVAVEGLVASGKYRVIGHAHPGDNRDMRGWFESIGAEFVPSFDEVMRRADLYVCDNSSTLYEFAATDRPVVVMSPPHYRRDVSHGIRFWSHIPGVECAIADHLQACVTEALRDVPERKTLRRAAVEAVYGPMDGGATQRAVESLRNPPEAEWRAEEGEHTYKLGDAVQPFDFRGRTWNPGDSVTHSQALAMKEAGHIAGKGIRA